MAITNRAWSRVAGISLAALLGLSAVGPAKSLVTHAASPTKLVFWFNDDPGWIKAYNGLIAGYTKLHPNVTITAQHYSFGNLPIKLQTVIGTSSAPDVVGIYGTSVTSFVRAGKFDPIPSSVYTADQIKATYFPAATNAGFYQGKYYSLPHEYGVENGGMLVDPAAFKAAGIASYPTTWAELKADAAKLTIKKGGNIKRAGFLFTSAGGPPAFFLALLLQQQGGHYLASDGIHVDFNTPQAAAAMQEMQNFQQYGDERDFPVSVLDVSDYLFRHQAAMAFRGPWTIAYGQGSYPKVKFDYTLLPSFTSQPPYFAAESGWSDVVTTGSAHKDVAWDFLKYVNSKDNDRAWNITTSSIPSRTDLVTDPAFLKLNPLLKPILGRLQYGRWIGPILNRDAYFNGIRRYCVKVFTHELSVTDALKQMTTELNAAVDKQLGSGQ